jgi:hypothetical protein
MTIKNYDEYTNEELGWKDAFIGAAMTLSPFSSFQAKSQTPYTQQQTQKVLSTVSFSRSQAIDYSKQMLDNVHGALGSKNLNDHFEKRVSDELVKQSNQGKKTDVSNIKVKTYVRGNNIITEASCDIIESIDGISYTHFATRGSIGDDYDIRHDQQINGLTGRLENLYGGKAKQVGDTLEITFKLRGRDVTYRQSFFVASDQKPSGKIVSQSYSIKGSNSDELRQKLKNETKGLSIDVNSITIDINKLEVRFKAGTTRIENLSLITDDKGVINQRLQDIKSKNPTMKVIKTGNVGGVDWALLVF